MMIVNSVSNFLKRIVEEIIGKQKLNLCRCKEQLERKAVRKDNSALAVAIQHRREMVTQKAFYVLQCYSRT